MAKNKAPKAVQSSGPRSKDEIVNEYNNVAYQAGNTQYQIKVYGRELERLNKRMEDLNYEMAERNNIDAQDQARKAKEVADAAALAKATGSEDQKEVANG